MTLPTMPMRPQPPIARPDRAADMTVRDRFALEAFGALVGQMLSETGMRALDVGCRKTGRKVDEQIAFLAYEFADAAMQERAK